MTIVSSKISHSDAMQIIKQTHSILVLQEKLRLSSWFTLLWVAGLVGIPLLTSYATIAKAGVATLTCQRTKSQQVDCDYRQSKFFGLVQSYTIPLKGLTGAKLETELRRNDSEQFEVYRVTLARSQKETPFTDFSADRQHQQETVDRIEAFLKSTEKSLIIQQDSRWQWMNTIWPLALNVAAIATGGSIAFFAFQVRTFSFDKNIDQLTCTTRTILGDRHQHYALSDIYGVGLNEQTDDDEQQTCTVALILLENKPISLLESHPTQSAKQLATRIQTFLNPGNNHHRPQT